MDKSKEKSYLLQLEKLVVDESQVVTYKLVSRTLQLHVNIAKQLLETFVTTYGKKYSPEFSSTHLLSGTKKDGSHHVQIVADSALEETRASYKNLTSDHVYSVQKSKGLDDYQSLYSVDTFDATCEYKASTIKCSLATEKTDVERAPVFVERKPLAKVTQNAAKKETAEPVAKKEEVKTEVKKNEPVKIEKPGKKTNSISSMFSAQQKKPQPPKKTVVAEEPKEKEAEKEDEPVIIEEKQDKPAKKATIKRKRPEKKVNVAIKKDSETKRKRIMIVSDSDESDHDVERVSSPEPEPEPPAPITVSDDEEKPSNSSAHKKKKRKLVEKQEFDDQGYLVTTKEYAQETDSEPEPEPQPAPSKKSPVASKPPPAKKSASPKKGRGKAASSDGRKQQSLLSFFKKS